MTLPERNHLFEQIHTILWDKICNGEIVSGQRLKDIEWARQLGVSRTPVREAMRKMQQEGVLLPLVQGGYEVRPTSRQDMTELYRCRAALEALATEEAASYIGKVELQKLDELIARGDTAIENGDLDAAFKVNTEFHVKIIQLSGNRHLQGLLDTLHKLVLFYRSALLQISKTDAQGKTLYLQRLRIKQDHHRAILDALRRKDGKGAAQLMQQHVRETAEDLLPTVADRPSQAGGHASAA